MTATKKCKSCGKTMISNTDLCSDCRQKRVKSTGPKHDAKYIRKNATFNRFSNKQMAVWNWCVKETDNFKHQNFADFIREKLEWCMQQEDQVTGRDIR